MKKRIGVCCALFIGIHIYAQNELKGKITDKKDSVALVGVIVNIPELKIAGITDNMGIYHIKNIPKGHFLVETRYVGYASQTFEVDINGLVELNASIETSNKDIEPVVVTGVSTATEQRTNPIPTTVINQKEFLQSSATNLIDALARTPGVSQITEGPAISKPVIRGLGYNRVVTMNDGVRQEGNQWGDEFGIEIDEYSVSKVEVLKGPASLAYGSDAMAGVINMIAPSALPEGQVKGSILGNFQTNNGLFGGSANIAGNIKGIMWDVRYTSKAAHAYQNKYDGYVWNSGYMENDVKGTIGINRRWGYSRIILSSYDLKLGIVEGARDSATGKFTRHVLGSGNTDSMAVAPSPLYTQYGFFPLIHQHVRHYKAVWDNSFVVGKGQLKLILGLQQNYRQEANNITLGDVYDNYFFLNTINYNVQYVLPEKKHWEVSFGVNGMQQNSQNRGTVYLVPEYNLFDLGGFAIAKKTFKKLSVSGGARYQLRNLQGKDMYTDSLGNKIATPNIESIHRFTAYNSRFTGFAGSIGATYDFSKNLYAKVNIARGWRAPNIAESGSNGIHDGTPFYEIGDPNLKPEVSTQIDLTFGVSTENFNIELNGFYNDISNYIFPEKLQSKKGGDSIRTDANAGLTGPTFKYISGNAVLNGGEAVFNIHPKNLTWIRFENSFSMVNAIQKNQPDSSKYLPYTPPYRINSQLVFPFKKIGKTLKNAYAKAGVDYYFEQNKVFYKFGNETITPAYLLVNLGLGADICNKNGAVLFSVFIYGSNLGDVAYQSNMSRLKYTDRNNITGRIGVYNMGRNISFKILIPINFKK
ncbi:MAG: TonB-dependent receptor [Bacteroidetes bacterium]|nr:TonB-dependent receptor [Bacteroidota bacterium]